MTAINQQTPGPVRAGHARSTLVSVSGGYMIADFGVLLAVTNRAAPDSEDAREAAVRANVKLACAAYTAFDGAGRHPEINGDAAMMAEALGADGLVEMIRIVKWAMLHADALGESAPQPIKDIGSRAAGIVQKLHRCR